MPMVRDYSTSGGHLPGDEVARRRENIVTKKWQGYPPENLNVLGKSMPRSARSFHSAIHRQSAVRQPRLVPGSAVREVSHLPASARAHQEHRYLRGGEDAGRAYDPDLQERAQAEGPGARGLASHARSASLRNSIFRAKRWRIVAAETEDQAEDAAAAIHVEYEVLPFASTLKDTMAPDAADLRGGKGNLLRHTDSPAKFPQATWAAEQGDIEKGFAEADIDQGVHLSLRRRGLGSHAAQRQRREVGWRQADVVGHGPGNLSRRAKGLASALGIEPSKIRFINKWNGSTFGAARMAAERFYPLIAHLAKVTGRPVKVMLPKDQELAQLVIKPETITKFKVGAKKDGRIIAIEHNVYVSVGELEFGVHARRPRQRVQPAGTVHVAGSELAIVVVRLSDERAAPRAVAQPHPAGNQVVLGKHDG